MDTSAEWGHASIFTLAPSGLPQIGPPLPASSRSIASNQSDPSTSNFSAFGAPVAESVQQVPQQQQTPHHDAWSGSMSYVRSSLPGPTIHHASEAVGGIDTSHLSRSIGARPIEESILSADLLLEAELLLEPPNITNPANVPQAHGSSRPSQETLSLSSQLASLTYVGGRSPMKSAGAAARESSPVAQQKDLEQYRRENMLLLEQVRHCENQLLAAFERINALTKERDELRDAFARLDDALTLNMEKVQLYT